MSMRGAALVGGWLLGVCLATAVSWTGVRMAGDEIAPSGSGSLSQAEVERRIRASGTALALSAEQSPDGGATASRLPPQRTTRKSVASRGGTVVFTCTGSTLTARFSPASGYAGRQHARDGTLRIEVRFSSDTRSSTVKGSCRQGTITAKVEESDHSEDD